MANLFKRVYTGTLAQYEALTTKDVNALYMLRDGTTGVKSMYKGEVKVSGDFIIAEAGAPAQPEKGIIYYIPQYIPTGSPEGTVGKPFVGFWNGSAWVALSDQATIDSLASRITTLEGNTKIDGSATAGTIGAEVHTLIGDSTVTGSVKEQVATAKAAIEGELKAGDSTTLAAINTELDAIDTKLGGVKLQPVTPTEANVKEEYKLVNGNGEIEGSAHIKVYKDSSLKEADFVTEKPGESEGSVIKGQFLKLTYILANGNESVVYVDMSSVITEAEVKNGIAVDATDGKLYVKRDNASEDFLTVGTDGIKLSGVQAAINKAVSDKNVDAEGDGYVSASAANNKVTVAATDSTKASLALADSALQSASGETGNSALVSVSVTDKNVGVAATDKLKSAVTSAESAVQTIGVASAGQEVTVSTKSEENGYTIGVTKATHTMSIIADNGEITTQSNLSATGLVDAAVLRNFVADEIAKNGIYWDNL